jgi:hypothetical protein
VNVVFGCPKPCDNQNNIWSPQFAGDQIYFNHYNPPTTKHISTTKDFSFCTTTNNQTMAMKTPL